MKNIGKYLMLFGLAAVVSLASCNKEVDQYAGNDLAPKITQIYLEDGQSSVLDRPVEFARLGQTIRIEGENLLGIVKVYINGYDSIFNQTFQSETSMIVTINTRVPIMDADPEARDKIRVVKRNGKETVVDFVIRASMPAITDVSHTLPLAGEQITIKGTNMHEASQVLFPGDIEGTIVSFDTEKGEWVIATVPEGINTSGSIKVVGANGTATSPPYFNFKEGILHNFDDVSNASWASGVETTTMTDVTLPAAGSTPGPKSQGNYNLFNAAGKLGGSDQRYWLNSTNIGGIMSSAVPGTTAADMCGIQIDIFVEGEWTSGIIRMTMLDGLGDGRGCMTYEPIYPGGVVNKAAFVNPGCWFTITMPFSLATQDFAGKTLADIITAMAGASYKQAGPWFDNKAAYLPEGAQTDATQKIYFDNIRIVPLQAPAVTDYPEEEEEGEESGEEGAE